MLSIIRLCLFFEEKKTTFKHFQAVEYICVTTHVSFSYNKFFTWAHSVKKASFSGPSLKSTVYTFLLTIPMLTGVQNDSYCCSFFL
jgi:hypothetical protein